MTLDWIAQRLNMRTAGYAAHRLRQTQRLKYANMRDPVSRFVFVSPRERGKRLMTHDYPTSRTHVDITYPARTAMGRNGSVLTIDSQE